MIRRLLLVSSSTVHGSGYLDHCEPQVRELLPRGTRVLFVPYALHRRTAYASLFRRRAAAMGLEATSVHTESDPINAVGRAGAIFIGGGNTFRLLDTLYRLDLLEPIRHRVLSGVPYIGTSAGSNVACITIKTTNDMPIVHPPSLDALGLVPFNINPHYLDPDPTSTHAGETREDRIREFHEENDPPVVGLREGTMLRVEDGGVTLLGGPGARIFIKDKEPCEAAPGADLGFLLG